MEGRGGVSSCCPGVPGFLISSAIAAAADNGRILHNSFSLPDEREEIIQDQREILLRNNSDHAVHIPSDRDVLEPAIEKDTRDAEGPRSTRASSSYRLRIPGVACIGRIGRRILRGIVCDPLLTTRITVMVLLSLLVAVMTILTWYFATIHATKAVSNVAEVLRGDLLGRAEGITTTLLQNNNISCTALARLLSSSLISGNYSEFSTLEQQVRPILFSAYSVIAQQSVVSYFGKNGLFIAYSSEFKGASVLSSNTSYLRPGGSASPELPWTAEENLTVTRPWYHWDRQEVDSSTGLPTGAGSSVSPVPYWAINVFNDTWSGREGSSWGIVTSQNNDLLILCLSPVKQESDINAVGVAGVGVSVSEISRSLEKIDLQGGDMYFTTGDGSLLVQTKMAVDYKIGELGTPLLPKATSSNNPIVAAAARYLASVLGSNATVVYHTSNVVIEGRQYSLSSSPVNISPIDLVCVVLVPRDGLWGFSDRKSHTILALLLILAVSVIVGSCFLLVLLAKGVSNEMRLRASLIQQMEATKHAENKSSHKNIVFASMSHDLRTPLAAILGLIDLCLCDVMESSELESNLSQMKSCATSLLGILNSILDMSKIEAGKLQLEESEFDLLEVLEEAVEMFAVVGMKKGLDVVLDLPDDSIEKSSRILGDAGRVKQLLTNLLSNGVKFTSSGHVVLRAWRKPPLQADKGGNQGRRGGLWGCIYAFWTMRPTEEVKSCEQTELDEGEGSVDLVEYEFEVDDTGKGIPRDRRKAVFENFVQVDSSVPRTHGGTGLGLGIVRSLVRLMGGDITIIDKDEPGEPGARFKFNLLLQVHRENTVRTSGSTPVAELKMTNSTEPVTSRHLGSSGAIPKGTISSEEPVAMHSLANSPSPYCYSPSRADGVHVLLAMQGQAGKKAAKHWMERRGLRVWTVSHHEDFLPTLEKIKSDVFYEESFNWSDCFESSPANEYDAWVPEDSVQAAACELSATPSSTYLKKLYAEESGPRLLLVIDTAMVSSILEVLCVSIHNSLTQGGIAALSRVVWLVTPNTPSSLLQILKQGTAPCDLMLHKPLNVSRLRVLWGQVQFLIQNRDVGSTGNKPSPSFTVSYGGSPLGEFQVSVPPPSPIHDERPAKESPPSGSWPTARAASGGEQYVVNNGGTDYPSVDNNLAADSNLETQALVHTSSSPSPEVGPFPRVKYRESEIMGPPNSLKGMRILVAEDNPVLQRLTKTMLVKLGATVECVDNGLEAAQLLLASLPRRKSSSRSSSFGSFRRLRSISREQAGDEENPLPKKRPFDMVLMDCQMPVLDGYRATQRIREQEKVLGWRTPVIALTAHAMAKDETKCIEAGMDFYLTKPFAPKALLNVVAKINSNTDRKTSLTLS